jgi:hypothetical protein
MSWKAEMKCSGDWSSNALRFATQTEAEASGKELMYQRDHGQPSQQTQLTTRSISRAIKT